MNFSKRSAEKLAPIDTGTISLEESSQKGLEESSQKRVEESLPDSLQKLLERETLKRSRLVNLPSQATEKPYKK